MFFLRPADIYLLLIYPVNKRIKVIKTTLLCTVEFGPTPICYTEQFYEHVCENSETQFQLGISLLKVING